MRIPGLAAVALAAITMNVSDADAGQWCAMYTRGSENCSYVSQQQCMASVSGLPAFCQPNPFPSTNFGRSGSWGSAGEPTRYQRDR
jgi:hypothetical protein